MQGSGKRCLIACEQDSTLEPSAEGQVTKTRWQHSGYNGLVTIQIVLAGAAANMILLHYAQFVLRRGRTDTIGTAAASTSFFHLTHPLTMSEVMDTSKICATLRA